MLHGLIGLFFCNGLKTASWLGLFAGFQHAGLQGSWPCDISRTAPASPLALLLGLSKSSGQYSQCYFYLFKCLARSVLSACRVLAFLSEHSFSGWFLQRNSVWMSDLCFSPTTPGSFCIVFAIPSLGRSSHRVFLPAASADTGRPPVVTQQL